MTGLLLLALALAQSSVRERMDEALALARSGDTEQAVAIFESIVDDVPQHGPARLQLGRLAVERGDFETARTHLELAVSSQPARPALAWYLLGLARDELGDRAGAIKALDRATATNPEFVPAYVRRGQMALDDDDLWGALRNYRAAARLNPARSDAFAAIANVARRMGASELARCSADAAVSKAPDNGSLHYLLGVVAEQQGEIATALAAVERALELGFENAAVYITLGNLQHERMDLSQAIAAFEKGLTLDPAAAESIASFALASLTTSDYATLRDLLESYVAASPDSINTLYALGAMYLRDGELGRSAEVFERLTTLDPESSEAQYNLAMTYLRQSRKKEGAEAMSRFRRLKALEDEAWERSNRREKRWAHVASLREQERHDEAAELGLELTESGASTTAELVAVSDSLVTLGRPAEAVELVHRALESTPYDRSALSLAASLGDDEATRHLDLLDPKCR